MLLTLLFPLFLHAQAQTPPPIAEQYRWLYEILFTEVDRTAQPAESFKSFYPHLLDSYQQFPEPKNILRDNLRSVEKVEGTLTYVNVVKKNYVYDILKSADGTLVLNIRIHLKDPVGDDVKNFREKLQAAEDIWNNSRVPADFKYAFKFDLVDSEAESLYSVLVFDKTRGPYDRNWGRDWTPTTIAHEAGHMMGIADEYQTLSGKMDCMPVSLMCDSGRGHLMPHHFYFILRRLLSSVQL